MKRLRIEEAAAWLLKRDDYLILTHRRPDGDTIGSAAFLCRLLRKRGKRAYILENPQTTARYAPYLEGLTRTDIPVNALVITVDIAGLEMLPIGAEELRPAFLIDHHGSNPGFAPEGVVHAEAAACGEIVYEISQAMGEAMDRPMAEALYVAVSTDTGCFRYSNTTASTLKTAAACLEAGIDSYALNKLLFETVSLARLRLNAYMTEHLELLQGGAVALCFIPDGMEKALGVTEDDLDDVSNFARNIEGVELAVTFRTVEGGDTKLSVRSSPRYDAAALCGCLGGGGHRAAAGATVHTDQAAARVLVLNALKRLAIL